MKAFHSHLPPLLQPDAHYTTMKGIIWTFWHCIYFIHMTRGIRTVQDGAPLQKHFHIEQVICADHFKNKKNTTHTNTVVKYAYIL